MQRVSPSQCPPVNAQQITSTEKVWEKIQGILLVLKYPRCVVKVRQAEKKVTRELLERSRDDWEANSF